MINKLNNSQLEAVNCTKGPLLILAGAGSGKTSVITHRISHMIKDLGIDPKSILAITFTNKAADEMKSRVSKVVGANANGVFISTFHSFCVRVLRSGINKLGYSNNFTIYDSDDQISFIKRIIKELNIDIKQTPPKKIRNKISSLKNNSIDPKLFEREHIENYSDKIIAKIYKTYEIELRKSNALDFDDLLLKTVQLFETDKEVLEFYQDRFKYIMVDEYQDTNNIQFKLIQLLARKYHNICVVGDDDQSIYKFRGADITNILNFEKHFPNTKQVKLEQNYRSTSQILDCANELIKNNKNRKNKKMFTERTDGDKASFVCLNTAYEEADYIIEVIKDNFNSGLNYNDITVLYRASQQSRIIEEKLIYNNIPYVMIGGVNFYQRKEIKDVISYLRVIENKTDDLSLRRIINTPKRGIGNTTVDYLSDYANSHSISIVEALNTLDDIPNISRAKNKLQNFKMLLDDIYNYYSTNNIACDIINYVLDVTGYVSELELENTDESLARIENIKELLNKAIDSDANLTEFLSDISLVSDVDNLDPSSNKVNLMTIHASKGLEFPVVIICGMEDGVFPSYMTLQNNDTSELEEERRICYVAITRAIDKLYFTSAKSRLINGELNYNNPSTFIREIPKSMLNTNVDTDIKNIDNSSNDNSFYNNTSYHKKHNYYTNTPLEKPKLYDISSLKGMPEINKDEGLEYKVGDKVSHIKYGVGKVLDIKEGARDFTVTVAFENGETRNLLAAFAKLKKVN